MPDNETPAADGLEQRQDLDEATAAIDTDVEVSIEAPEADSVEQQTPVDGGEATADPSMAGRWDVDEGDLAESSREVGYDDEDYR